MGYTYSNSSQAVGTTNPRVLAYTCAAGVHLLVIGLGSRSGARTGGTPTYNGIAMTQAGTTATQTTVSSEIWYLLNPPTGVSYNISVPNTGALSVRIIASSYIPDENYIYALDVATQGVGTTANPSLSLTPSVNGCVIVDMMCNELNTADTARNQTLLFTTDEGVWNTAAMYALQPTAGLITFTHTIGADNWGMNLASFKQINRVNMIL
jgi:hypothetical protein